MRYFEPSLIFQTNKRASINRYHPDLSNFQFYKSQQTSRSILLNLHKQRPLKILLHLDRIDFTKKKKKRKKIVFVIHFEDDISICTSTTNRRLKRVNSNFAANFPRPAERFELPSLSSLQPIVPRGAKIPFILSPRVFSPLSDRETAISLAHIH